MVVIRLARTGAKKKPFYHIVVADSRFSRDGRRIEVLGYFNPSSEELKLDSAQFDHWVEKGAKPSDTVKSLRKRVEKAAA